nr:DUF1343 domain-containing protein [Saprospiraceae bacterium]
MRNLFIIGTLLSLVFALGSYSASDRKNSNSFDSDFAEVTLAKEVVAGVERMEEVLKVLEGKRVGLVINPSSMVGERHLLDTLIDLGVAVHKIFALEHGFRGDADAGELIKDSRDVATGLPVVSLYGQNRKPQKEDLKALDLILFDIQDVGVRFYTYISSLHYIMEAAAENGVKVVVTDRPNPNGFYVDGPVLEEGFKSFVGMHPVPVIHGMTIGEYALMIRGEQWIEFSEDLQLEVIPCLNYDHSMTYDLPVRPSPNLPNLKSVLLYPSLCFFEGTEISVGRGTHLQFQLIGSPYLTEGDTVFIPHSLPGATQPPFLGQKCTGYSFSNYHWKDFASARKLDLSILLMIYNQFPEGQSFFLKNNFFDRLAGTDRLRKQIIAGWDEETIRAEWQSDLQKFQEIRSKYVLYDDF